MSVEELRQQYEFWKQYAIRNINCGYLRGIGKTECLKQMIEEYINDFVDGRMDMDRPLIGLLVCNISVERQYDALRYINIITTPDRFYRETYSPRTVFFLLMKFQMLNKL